MLVQGLVAVSLELSPPGFSPSGLSTNQRGGRRQGGGTQQALPGAQVVLLHWAVLVALMAGTVHFIITGGLLGERRRSGWRHRTFCSSNKLNQRKTNTRLTSTVCFYTGVGLSLLILAVNVVWLVGCDLCCFFMEERSVSRSRTDQLLNS